jgi:hypothetical protein
METLDEKIKNAILLFYSDEIGLKECITKIKKIFHSENNTENDYCKKPIWLSNEDNCRLIKLYHSGVDSCCFDAVVELYRMSLKNSPMTLDDCEKYFIHNLPLS